MTPKRIAQAIARRNEQARRRMYAEHPITVTVYGPQGAETHELAI